MLIKHIKDIDTEDEYIKIKPEETVFEVSKKLIKEDSQDLNSSDTMYTPVLAAYVMEGEKPIGIVYREDIIEEIILSGKDPKKTLSKDIMKPPITISINEDVREALNLIIDKGFMTIAACDGDKLVSVISVYDAIFLNAEIEDF